MSSHTKWIKQKNRQIYALNINEWDQFRKRPKWFKKQTTSKEHIYSNSITLVVVSSTWSLFVDKIFFGFK